MKKFILSSITAILLSSSIVANAASGCRNIFFAVKNETGYTIDLQYISYRDYNVNLPRFVRLGGVTCLNNTVCRTSIGQMISATKEIKLNNFRFEYNYSPPAVNTSPRGNSVRGRSNIFKANNLVCVPSRTYGGRHWIIR